MKVTALATRSGDWWAIEVPEVAGVFTQTRRLEQVPAMVADAVATMLDVPADSVEVSVQASLGPELDEVMRQARDAAEQAKRAQEVSSQRMRSTVKMLRQDLTTRDVASLLGVTQQRVSQLERAAG